MSFGRVVCNDQRKAKFDTYKILSKVKVTGVKKPVYEWLFLSSYLYNSKSYYPILMTFGRMVKNDKRKTKLDSQENWSKFKVTGQGYRGQISIKNDCF